MKVGILGGGQLGRMIALSGIAMGLEFRYLDSAPSAPMSSVAESVVGPYNDAAALERLAAGAVVVTYEFENVPLAAAHAIQRSAPLYPPPAALAAAQDRVSEKELFRKLGIPCAPFRPVESAADLAAAVRAIGLPAILKTRRMGYDGRGQRLLRDAGDVERGCDGGETAGYILEGIVPFDREVSLLAVRGRTGETAYYPLVENHHRDGILRLSLGPAPRLTHEMQALAEEYAARLLSDLGYVGVLAIEFFDVGGRLVANEMAPRVHNSGHWTIEGSETSQFENHLRAILGLPLGSTAMVGSAAMVNLIGDLPETAGILGVPGAHLHLYGKVARAGRKVGHITLRAPDNEARTLKLAALLACLRDEVI